MSPAPCPSCGVAMEGERYEAHYGASLDIDVCHACQALWFDQREAQRLTPDSTVKLIESMRSRGGAHGPKLVGGFCPRCHSQLKQTFDRVRGQVVSYLACPNQCGRLLSFMQFLKEKQYLRDATEAELAALKATVKQVNCSSCGAPVQLSEGTRCGYCQAPVAFLDASNLGALVAGLQVPAARPEELARAATDVERLLTRNDSSPQSDSALQGDLVAAGLSALMSLLRG